MSHNAMSRDEVLRELPHMKEDFKALNRALANRFTLSDTDRV